MLSIVAIPLFITTLVGAQGGCPMMVQGMMGEGMMGQGMMKGGGMMKIMGLFHSPQMAEMLNLTEDQQAKLKDLKYSHEEKVLEIRQKIEREQLALARLLEADKLDKAQIEAKIRTIGSLRTDMQLERVRVFIDVRNLLTEKQLEQLENMSMGPMGTGPAPSEGQSQPGQGMEGMHH